MLYVSSQTWTQTCWVSLMRFPQLHSLSAEKSWRCLQKDREPERSREEKRSKLLLYYYITKVQHRRGQSKVCLFVCFERPFTNSQWFSPSHQLLQLLTVNMSSCRGSVISFSSKKDRFHFKLLLSFVLYQYSDSNSNLAQGFRGIMCVFNIPANVNSSLYLSLSLICSPMEQVNKRTFSSTFTFYCTIKSYLPSKLVSARTFQIILETLLSQKSGLKCPQMRFQEASV